MATTNAQLAFDAFYDELQARFKVAPPVRQYGENRNWPIFLQLATICAARGWNPADYVRKTMDGCGRIAKSLLPSDLLRARALAAYKGDAVASSAEEEYRDCVELIIQREMDGEDEKPLLLSPLTAFPAWFRVVYPEQIDMEIVGIWGEVAKRELSSSPERIALLKKLDPEKWEKLRKVLWICASPEGGQK